MAVHKPRRRRVWDNPPETRKAWKRSKRADLPKNKATRHVSGSELRKKAKKEEKRKARLNDNNSDSNMS